MALISPLWQRVRNGWARSHVGSVLVENRWWNTANAARPGHRELTPEQVSRFPAFCEQPLLLVMLALSIGFGQLDTSLAATAGIVLGDTERVGLLFCAIAGGSAVGGLVFEYHVRPSEH